MYNPNPCSWKNPPRIEYDDGLHPDKPRPPSKPFGTLTIVLVCIALAIALAVMIYGAPRA